MLLFYGLKFHVCIFLGNPKNPQMCVLSKNFSTLGSNLVRLTLVPVYFYLGFYQKSFVLTWAWVIRVRFQIDPLKYGFHIQIYVFS